MYEMAQVSGHGKKNWKRALDTRHDTIVSAYLKSSQDPKYSTTSVKFPSAILPHKLYAVSKQFPKMFINFFPSGSNDSYITRVDGRIQF
jgi:hypothetical protein